MQRLRRPSHQEQVFVQPELAQAGLDDLLQCLRRRHVAGQVYSARFDCGDSRIEQGIATFGLGQDAQPEGHGGIELAREGEQCRGIAALQLELDFADRRSAIAGHHRAAVDDQLDKGFAFADVPYAALDPDFEDWCELVGAFAEQRLDWRRVVEDRRVARDRAFPFGPGEQAGRAAAAGLDRLDPLAPDAADAQRESSLQEGMIGGVEIERPLPYFTRLAAQ